MVAAGYRNACAGMVLGGVSAFLTYHIRGLIFMDPNAAMRALKSVAFAMVVPGLIAGMVSGNSRVLAPPVMAGINFVFWFGFGWLFATFITKFIKLRRAIAATGGPGDRSSSLESR